MPAFEASRHLHRKARSNHRVRWVSMLSGAYVGPRRSEVSNWLVLDANLADLGRRTQKGPELTERRRQIWPRETLQCNPETSVKTLCPENSWLLLRPAEPLAGVHIHSQAIHVGHSLGLMFHKQLQGASTLSRFQAVKICASTCSFPL